MMGNRAREIEGYAALEYPREPVAAVVRMVEGPSKSSGWRLRGPRLGRAGTPSGATCPALRVRSEPSVAD